MIYCFYWKTSAWSKGNPFPNNCCLIIILRCSGRKFLVWVCEETSSNKHGWTPVKYLNILHDNRTQKWLQHSLQKILPTSYFGYFWHIWPLPSKTITPTCQLVETLMFICMQKMNSLPNLYFWDIVKILQTYYFDYFENDWSYPAVMIVSPCKHLWCPKCWNQPAVNFDIHLQAKNELPS